MIRISRVYHPDDISLEQYQLSLLQMRYSGHPSYIIKRQKKNYVPYVIYKDDEVIGVFALETGPVLTKFGASETDVYLRGLSISHQHQGKGYFKQALKRIEEEVIASYPDASHLFLLVNVKNNAYYAFIKSGFTDGRRVVKQGIFKLKLLMKMLK